MLSPACYVSCEKVAMMGELAAQSANDGRGFLFLPAYQVGGRSSFFFE